MGIPEAFKSTPLGVILRSVSQHPALLYNDEKRQISEPPTANSSVKSVCEKSPPVIYVDWYVESRHRINHTLTNRDGPDDVENPKNWSAVSKTMVSRRLACGALANYTDY